MEFHDLVEKHDRRIFAVCYRLLNHAQDAEDACQDAKLKLFRHYEAVREGGWSYVLKVVTSVCNDLAAARGRRGLLGVSDDQAGVEIAAAPAPARDEPNSNVSWSDNVPATFGASLFRDLSTNERARFALVIESGASGWAGGSGQDVFDKFLRLVSLGLTYERALEILHPILARIVESGVWDDLQPLQKKTLLLQFIGLKTGMIAKVLGTTPSTVSKSLTTGRQRIR